MILATANPEYVKAEIRTRFGSVFEFERQHGLPRKSVSDVLRGRANARVKSLITEILESDLSDGSSQNDGAHRLNEAAK